MTHTSRCGSVLIVEDDRDIREAIAEVLMLEGYRATTASNGKAALDHLRGPAKNSKPCLILLDLMMPVMNGWEFLVAQRSDPALRNIPVMICSAVGDQAKFPGIVEILRKPIDLDELIGLVKRHCDPALNIVHVS